METIVGLIPDEAHIKNAERELREAGISENKMHVLLGSANFWENLCSKEKARLVFKDAVIGAFIGLTLGGLIGMIAGVLNCRLMDCPIGTSLIFLALIVLYCAFAGALFGTWIGLDRAERSLLAYVADAHRDQALFVVETSTETAPEARHILELHGILVDVNHEDVERMEEQGLER
jgi:hypothetical protein